MITDFKLEYDNKENSGYQTYAWSFDFFPTLDIMEELKTATFKSLDGILDIPQRQNLNTRSYNLNEFLIKFNQNVLDQVYKTVFSSEIKTKFLQRWPITQDQFYDYFYASTAIFRDPENFSMSPHLDNQSVVGNVILNIDDNLSTTSIHNYLSPSKIVFTSGGTKNKGFFFLNTPGALHSITNGDKIRHIIYTSIMLKQWK